MNPEDNNSMSNAKDHRFHSSVPDFRIAIITGACRSGKTTIGQILGSMNNVEYIDEPWFPTVLPVMQNYGSIDPDVAVDMLRAFTKELFNDIILLRQSNFRPNDLSTIWARKDVKDIMDRLVKKHTRDDVEKYIEEKNPILLYNLAELIPFMSFFIKTFPDCRIIHVIRNGFDVAQEVVDKQWFSNEKFKEPLSNYYLFRVFEDSGKHYIPWWVKRGEERKFLRMNDYTKGLYYWRNLLEINKEDVEIFKIKKSNQYMEIKFEDIFENPGVTAKTLGAFLGVDFSDKTVAALGLINKNKVEKKSYNLENVPAVELDKAKKVLSNFGYDIGNSNNG